MAGEECTEEDANKGDTMSAADWIINHITRRPPDIQIGGADNPYLNRWYVIPRNRLFNIYLHQFMRDDDDRALHDHPWWSLSWLMRGMLGEFSKGGFKVITVGQWKFRSAKFAHRLEVPGAFSGNTWTLFITSPRIREWGFHCPNGWVHWRAFTEGENGETVGKGCAS